MNQDWRDIKAGNDVVGRDKNQFYLPHPRPLDLLSTQFKEDVEEDNKTYDILDELTHYQNTRSDVRDLKQKLSEAGFDYLIDEAEELKEVVAKLIVKNQHYKSAQKIITFLLADIESTFNATIKPKLQSTTEEHQVKALFREYLEGEIQEKLGENVLDIYNRQVAGMVYFLTGNCHLEWK
ncbi:ABC-three component system protein [Desulforhopalus sp. IMCC35007]|uniref:ABC-three component system protein n=1 Tax=Desulforhopalus sp. IMCC35007 TaxID=2569543 RepID=UPI0010AED936|nr:ABC-three component system protein [Desulforhopalus sp. IMCC35007]TKB07878.1 hypothetical protein FCL48_16140 [Desulforhopalus sp. IMCC35007]